MGAGGPATGRILVVDDQRTNVELMADLLRQQGYEVRTALDGKQALEIVQREPLDLVVSDIMMPGVDGYELLTGSASDCDLDLVPDVGLQGLEEVEGPPNIRFDVAVGRMV